MQNESESELIEKLTKMGPELRAEIQQQNVANLKRYYAKLERLDSNLKSMDAELQFLNTNFEDKELLQKILFEDAVQSLMLNLEEVENKNIANESQEIHSLKKDHSAIVKDIVEEFEHICAQENDRNKKMGLFVKKGFISSQEDDIDQLKKTIEKLNKEIQKELEKIRELEERDIDMIQNISLLERLNSKKA